MQWLQDPNSSIVDSLNKVRRDGSRHCRNTKKERLKTNIDELETNSKIKKKIRDLYRGISDFRTNYQPRTDILKDQKSDLVTDSDNILAMWRNHFSQLLNIHRVNDVRQTEIHTAEPLVPEPSAFEVEMAMAIEKLKRTQITRY